jgi:hypothetical protein
MLFNKKLLWVGLLVGFGICAATAAQAGTQLFEASWTVKAFGNECSKANASFGPYCPKNAKQHTGASEFYEGSGMPLGIKCNPTQPRCAFDLTPTNGVDGGFHPLGGSLSQALHCAPWYNFQGLTTGNGAKTGTTRPAKGGTGTTGGANGRPLPPLYRNPGFFTPAGEPDDDLCTATSTDAFGGKGLVQEGKPVTGLWSATTTGNVGTGGFSFGAAPATIQPAMLRGFRTAELIGEFGPVFPYLYSYTYATLRNDAGIFGPGNGPGTFSVSLNNAASIMVKQGAAKFGGTMRMLGSLTSKVCYFRNDGCSLGGADWRYDAAGAGAYTKSGVVTAGYNATAVAYYYHTGLMQKSTVNLAGARFPWTTGSVTVTARGNGPHKTVHYARGYDNRNTTTPNGMGTIQLVTPLLTNWNQPALLIDTGGIGILRIKFVPEPQAWAMLVAGVSLLGVVYRIRGR